MARDHVVPDLPRGFEHEIDFKKFRPDAVYKWAEKGQFIADIENPTFWNALKAFFTKQYDNS